MVTVTYFTVLELPLRISNDPIWGLSQKMNPIWGYDSTVEEKSGWPRGGGGVRAAPAPAQALHVRGLRCDSTMSQSQTAAARVLGKTRLCELAVFFY